MLPATKVFSDVDWEHKMYWYELAAKGLKYALLSKCPSWLTVQPAHCWTCACNNFKMLYTCAQSVMETNRIIFELITKYLLCFNQWFHHCLIQRQFMFVGRRLNKLSSVVFNVHQQHTDQLILHWHSTPGPQHLRHTGRLTFTRFINQFLQQTAFSSTSLPCDSSVYITFVTFLKYFYTSTFLNLFWLIFNVRIVNRTYVFLTSSYNKYHFLL